MADILVQYETKKLKIKKYRMWNTVVDAWTSSPLLMDEMLFHLQTNGHTRKEAMDRVTRRNYAKIDLDWLHTYFDSRVDALSRTHARLHGRAKRIKKLLTPLKVSTFDLEECSDCGRFVLPKETRCLGFGHGKGSWESYAQFDEWQATQQLKFMV